MFVAENCPPGRIPPDCALVPDLFSFTTATSNFFEADWSERMQRRLKARRTFLRLSETRFLPLSRVTDQYTWLFPEFLAMLKTSPSVAAAVGVNLVSRAPSGRLQRAHAVRTRLCPPVRDSILLRGWRIR